jgi:methyl-accepting chemotaxis protein
MPHQVKAITIFLSSPGDVASERKKIIQEINAWNQRNLRSSGISFQPLTWEDAVSSDIGAYSQEVINRQIGNYDVFLGLMWGRFGTKTAVAESGTEEEYLGALERSQSGQLMKLCFLFRNDSIAINEIDIEQLSKVRDFKVAVQRSGVLYGEYEGDLALSRQIIKILDSIAIHFKEDSIDGAPGINLPKNPMSIGRVINVEDDEEDNGLFEFEDNLHNAVERFLVLNEKWTSSLRDLGNYVETRTEQLNRIAIYGRDRSAFRDEIGLISNKLNEYSKGVSTYIDEVINSLDQTGSNVEAISEFSLEFTPESERSSLENTIIPVLDSINYAIKNMESLNSTIASLPRMSKSFNRARSEAYQLHERYIAKLKTESLRMSQLLEKLQS